MATVKLEIEFQTQAQLDEFAQWLCNIGEQNYWQSTEEHPDVPDGDAVRFHYHGIEKTEYPRDDARRYGPFMADNVIRTTTIEPETG